MTAALGLWLIVLWWNSPPATIGEAALREAHRRSVVRPATRSVTDADLPQSPRPPDPASLPPIVAADAEVPASAVPSATVVTRDEAWWRAQVVAAREAVARDQVLADALVSRLNALERDISARDDPAQRAKLMQQRSETVAEHQRVLEQSRVDAKALADVLEEARKAGVPPGWLR